jgi:hypothetical protein
MGWLVWLNWARFCLRKKFRNLNPEGTDGKHVNQVDFYTSAEITS